MVGFYMLYTVIFSNDKNQENEIYDITIENNVGDIEETKLLQADFGDKKDALFVERDIEVGYGHIDSNLVLKIDGNEESIDTYNFAGYNEEKIEEIFVYESNKGDILVVVTSWNTKNRAMGTYGNFYRVYFYDVELNKIDLESEFPSDYDGESDLGNFLYPYKTQEPIEVRLKELGY